MTYQVTARRWRPKVFDELVGQEHVVQTLKNAIQQNRLAQAYLFSGTRGVGKTTTARILAKSINCDKEITNSPCGKCDRCMEISEGNSIDVIEIDGASNNSVEDIRELRENVKYAPAKSRFKIYIIDEVHMLSKSAFNALLKTLEEPPNHVKFIFATTEENKIPETILSRCQCFEFRPISLKESIFQLKKITSNDGISIGEESLALIARAAEGSMRDAESILDQVISFAGKEVNKNDIISVLGLVGFDLVTLFLDKIIEKKPAPLLELFNEIVFKGQDIRLFLKELLEYLRNLIVLKVSKKSKELISISPVEMERLKQQTEKISLDELHQVFKIISNVESEIKRSSYPIMVVEMALIRLTEVRPFQSIDHVLASLSRIEQGIKIGSGITSQPLQNNAQTSGSQNLGDKPAVKNTEELWEEIKIRTKGKKNHLGLFLDNGNLIKHTDTTIEIGFFDKFTLDRMQKNENKEILTSVINELFNKNIEVLLKEIPKTTKNEEGKKKTTKDQHKKNRFDKEIIQEALNVFGGEIV